MADAWSREQWDEYLHGSSSGSSRGSSPREVKYIGKKRSIWGMLTGRNRSILATGERTLDQTIDIAVGEINPAQIIKFCVIAAILIGISILFIGILRGFLVGWEQFVCGINHVNLNPVDAVTGTNQNLGEECNPYRMAGKIDPNVLAARFWLWDIQWYLLCFLYIAIAVIIGLLLWQYVTWLFNKLMHFGTEIRKIENWIFQDEWSGEAEKQIETRL